MADYESLINVENINLKHIFYSEGTDNYSAYSYNGGDRGAKIWIQNSNFRDSRFCKGMIVYRKQNYIKETLSFTNFTHLYMISKNIQDQGSYIVLQGSTF